MTRTAEPVSVEPAELAEGLRWDADRQELLWVDLNVGHFHRYQLHNGVLQDRWVFEPGSTDRRSSCD